jgi:hypothetical protein
MTEPMKTGWEHEETLHHDHFLIIVLLHVLDSASSPILLRSKVR